MIRAAVGISTLADSTRAALDAARQAVQGLDGHRADWCVAFVTAEHESELPGLIESLSGALGTPYIVGCSACGILTAGRELEHGPALGLLAVSSDQVRATPFMFRDEGDQGLTAGIRLGQRLVNSIDSDDLLLVWPDPYHVRPDRLLQSLDAVLGPVPVVGGASSSNGSAETTFQFCGTEYGPSSVSGLRLGGRFSRVVRVTQGCRPLGPPLRVTSAHDNLVLEIEGRPALEMLRERAPSGLMDDPEWGLNFLCLGLLPDPQVPEFEPGEFVARNIVSCDPDTGVLVVADHVEEGQYVLFAHRDADSASADLRRILDRLEPPGAGMEYRFGLYFNCLARGRSLYGQSGVDSKLLEAALPGVPLLGFFCNAEIGPLQGVNRLLTYTGVLVLVAE